MKAKWGLVTFLFCTVFCCGILWFILFRGFVVNATILSFTFLEESQGTTLIAKAHDMDASLPGITSISPNLVGTTVTFIPQYEVLIEYKKDGEQQIAKIFVEIDRFENIAVGDRFEFSDKIFSLNRLYIEK